MPIPEETVQGDEPTVPSGKAIREVRAKDRGVMFLYVLDPALAGPDSGLMEQSPPVLGFALSFPASNSGISVKYKVNNIHWETGIWRFRVTWTVFAPLGGRWPADGRARVGRPFGIKVPAPCALFAGRRMPGGEEAMLIGFNTISKVRDCHLPQSRGFEVLRLQDDPTGGGRITLALTRTPKGSPELFAMMAEDLMDLLDSRAPPDEERVFQSFLGRIRAWQDFMDRRREEVLSAEAEQGLVGELLFLQHLMDGGLPATDALNAWKGPLDGLQDFMLGTGGIEVKSTLAPAGFLAVVSSLGQLDEELRRPIFLAAVRLALHPSGFTLSEMSDHIRNRLVNRSRCPRNV